MFRTYLAAIIITHNMVIDIIAVCLHLHASSFYRPSVIHWRWNCHYTGAAVLLVWTFVRRLHISFSNRWYWFRCLPVFLVSSTYEFIAFAGTRSPCCLLHSGKCPNQVSLFVHIFCITSSSRFSRSHLVSHSVSPCNTHHSVARQCELL